MTEAPTNATVLNTTVLSNFAQVDRAELLLDLPRLVIEYVRFDPSMQVICAKVGPEGC